MIYIYYTYVCAPCAQLSLLRPKTFNEMFIFNAAVMGFGHSEWMHLVLEQRLGADHWSTCAEV